MNVELFPALLGAAWLPSLFADGAQDLSSLWTLKEMVAVVAGAVVVAADAAKAAIETSAARVAKDGDLMLWKKSRDCLRLAEEQDGSLGESGPAHQPEARQQRFVVFIRKASQTRTLAKVVATLGA